MADTDAPDNFQKRVVGATLKPTSVAQVDNDKDLLILIMGPTGAGKSAFIEALSGSETLNISKDQLESYTQDVATYELNLTWSEGPVTDTSTNMEPNKQLERVYILDSPGFSDSQLSEFEIIGMVNKWMKAHKCKHIDCILFMCPITDIRLPGSKRRTMQMLKLLTGVSSEEPGTMVVVTTMWNRLWNERSRQAAEERFVQLRDDIWKDLLDIGGVVTKFSNTHESAMSIITTLCAGVIQEGALCDAYYMVEPGPKFHEAPYTVHLYQELLDRIQNSQQQIQSLEVELVQPETQANQELISDVEERLQKVYHLLTKFEMQLIAFGNPPPEFEHIIPFLQVVIKKHQRTRSGKTASMFIIKFKHFLQRVKQKAHRSR